MRRNVEWGESLCTDRIQWGRVHTGVPVAFRGWPRYVSVCLPSWQFERDEIRDCIMWLRLRVIWREDKGFRCFWWPDPADSGGIRGDWIVTERDALERRFLLRTGLGVSRWHGSARQVRRAFAAVGRAARESSATFQDLVRSLNRR